MQTSSSRDRPKPPPPPPMPGIKPPPPPPATSKPTASTEPCNIFPETTRDKRTRNEDEKSEARKVLKSLPDSTASHALWIPTNLRDVTAFQKKHQVGQGTYG
jgi:hypothetical protein